MTKLIINAGRRSGKVQAGREQVDSYWAAQVNKMASKCAMIIAKLTNCQKEPSMNVGTLANELTEIDDQIKQLEQVKTDADLQIVALRKRHEATMRDFCKAAYEVGDLVAYQGQVLRVKDGYIAYIKHTFPNVNVAAYADGQVVVVMQNIERASGKNKVLISLREGSASIFFPLEWLEPVE